jgi:hypothetical protein
MRLARHGKIPDLRAVLLALVLSLALAAPAGASTRLVRYDEFGGLAAITIHLYVNTDGSARQTGNHGNRRFQLTATQLRRLKRDLKAAHFETLKRSYRPDMPVLDGGTEQVAYKGHKVDVDTGADVPARLERLLRRLDSLVR